MKNLLEETVMVLERNGKGLGDIICVQGDDFEITVSNFIDVAQMTNYDSGYGSQEVAKDLKVIGEGWWLERREYDGAEWWEFCTLPKRINNIKKIKSLCGNYGWSSLEEINR